MRRKSAVESLRIWTAQEVADLMQVPVVVIEAQCRSARHERAPFSFFAGAWEESGEWRIPARAVEAALRSGGIEQHYSTADVADLYRLSVATVRRAIKAGRLRAVEFLGELRIPASSLRSTQWGGVQ